MLSLEKLHTLQLTKATLTMFTHWTTRQFQNSHCEFQGGMMKKNFHYTVECRKWENPATNKAFKKSLNNHTVSRLHDNHLFSCQKWRVIISRMFQLYSEAHFMTFLKRPSLISKVLPLSLKSVLKLSCLED